LSWIQKIKQDFAVLKVRDSKWWFWASFKITSELKRWKNIYLRLVGLVFIFMVLF
jgi:hypothetical protein